MITVSHSAWVVAVSQQRHCAAVPQFIIHVQPRSPCHLYYSREWLRRRSMTSFRWARLLWLCWTKWQLQNLIRPLIVHLPCIYMEVITMHLLCLQCICFWLWLQIFTQVLHNTKESVNQAQIATLCILILSFPIPDQEHHSCDEYRNKWPWVW